MCCLSLLLKPNWLSVAGIIYTSPHILPTIDSAQSIFKTVGDTISSCDQAWHNNDLTHSEHNNNAHQPNHIPGALKWPMNTNLEATTLEPTCLYATGIYNTTSITSWTNCGDSIWCFVKSGTGCLDVRPCLKCWWMWQHDSFHTTWNWMINTHMWDAVSAMLFTSAWHLTHQHIQLNSNVNSKKSRLTTQSQHPIYSQSYMGDCARTITVLIR